MEFSRNLKKGMAGEDVRYMKDALFALGYYAKNIAKITNASFGADTHDAVLRYQTAKKLTVDGIIGKNTWAAVEADRGIAPPASAPAKPGEKASELVLWAQSRLGDVYAWGACNLSTITESWIRGRDTSAANAERSIAYWKKAVKWGLRDLRAHDCSGLVSACLIRQGIIGKKYDCDGLWKICKEIKKAELIPGDLLFRVNASNVSDKTHTGIYTGRGGVIHAKGRDTGVVFEGIDQNGASWWAKFGRLAAY